MTWALPRGRAAPQFVRSIFSTAKLRNENFTTEEQNLILTKLNLMKNGDNRILGEKQTNNIEEYLARHGSFSKLEDLLKVPGIGPKSLRGVCTKLLKGNVGGVRKSRDVTLINPSLTPTEIKDINKVTSINVYPQGVTWALVDVNTKYLHDWKLHDFGDQSHNTYELIERGRSISESLPQSDLYLIEDPGNNGVRPGALMKSNLTCILSTVLLLKCASSRSKLTFLKGRVLERHFNVSVGTEVTTIQPIIADMIALVPRPNGGNLYIDYKLNSYMKTLGPYGREQLGRAALMSLTFSDLVLNKNL